MEMLNVDIILCSCTIEYLIELVEKYLFYQLMCLSVASVGVGLSREWNISET